MVAVVFALWLREVKRYLRSRPQIVASLGQPLMYLLVLGFGLGPVFEKAGQGELPPVRRAGRGRDDDPVLVDLLRRRPACGTGSSGS